MKQKIYIFFHILKIIHFMCKILLQNFMKDKNTWTKKKKNEEIEFLKNLFYPHRTPNYRLILVIKELYITTEKLRW